MRVAFLATDMVEQVELTAPWEAVEQEGWEPQRSLAALAERGNPTAERPG